MYLKREIDRHLEAWASESGRKPLLLTPVTGALVHNCGSVHAFEQPRRG